MQYVDELSAEFCKPYCPDEKVIRVMEASFQKAFQYADKHKENLAETCAAMKHVLKVVQCANREVMEEAEAVPYEANWKTPYPDLWSPVLDFTDDSPLFNDADRKIYSDDLSVLTTTVMPWIGEPYQFTEVESAVVLYDIWLQSVLLCKRPYTALSGLFAEPLF